MGTRKGWERSSPPCLSCLLKLHLEATNNKGNGGGATMHNYSPRTKKKKQGEEEKTRKEGIKEKVEKTRGGGKN
jgi:hypothetical protein